MKKKLWYGVIGFILLLGLVVGMVNKKELKAEETPLFTKENLKDTNIVESWKTFKKENKISSAAKLEDFNLVLDHTGNIESIKLKLIEKKENKFTVLNHQYCVNCPKAQNVGVTIWLETHEEWPQYDNQMNADEFFSNLATVHKKMQLWKDKNNILFLVRSREWDDEISLPGQYYSLENKALNKMDAPHDQLTYKGFNLQIQENESIRFESDENTINIILADIER
ncbi:hypothetical protein ACFSO7_07785 [Bacillus sp. CGMCC 1.16607]|uniref:hypothetical protein n=1 Tax=Bacillus sp. CGMCC 1.16607 TaxID=3351842 RepID=UPI0036325A8F